MQLDLHQCQEELWRDPKNQELLGVENSYATELTKLKKAKEEYLRQKSKCEWAQHGDENTAVFHASLRNSAAKNRNINIKDMKGKECNSTESIQAAFIDFYESLLGTSNAVERVNKRVIKAGNCLTAQHCEILTKHVTKEEVKQALFDIPDTKSPGPDGFGSQFYKDAWHIIGDEVTLAIQSTYNSGKLLKQLNSTCISLIPKVELPDNVTQFRPIACCNTLYKTLTKVLCARLNEILPDLIRMC